MTKFVATINVPGYLPETDPVEFDTAREAWKHLWAERAMHEDDFLDPDDDYSATYEELIDNWAEGSTVEAGTVIGKTPGYDGDYDLGIAYTVQCKSV